MAEALRLSRESIEILKVALEYDKHEASSDFGMTPSGKIPQNFRDNALKMMNEYGIQVLVDDDLELVILNGGHYLVRNRFDV